MNRQLRLAAAATMMAAVQFATAQVKMAPNYFRADPAVYKYRMAKVVEWKGTESEQSTTYSYDSRGCLIGEEYKMIDQPRSNVYYYTYDDKGYMIEKEEWNIKADQTDSLVSARHIYDRDEHGYVTEYARATLHGTDPGDRTLTEDVKMKFVYDDQMRLVRVDIRQFDYPSNKLEDNVGRVCKVEYDAAGHISRVSQIYPENDELVWAEEFSYDEQGRRISIKKVPGPNYDPQTTLTWTWHYNSDGDIDEHSCTNGFGNKFEYDKSKLSSETFMALEATEAEWALQGPLNCTLFKELPMEKGFTHAPIKEVEGEAYVIYEATGSTDGIDHTIAASQLQIETNGSELTINSDASAIGKPFAIYNSTGICVLTGVLKGTQTKISTQTFCPGLYLLSATGQTIKFFR